MIIQEIYIDGFGIYNGYQLTDLRPGLNIITGYNETGKSTLQKFIRFTLFGYPRSIEVRMAPLNGGSHGGRIKCQLASGEEVLFQRKPGSKNGEIELFHRGVASSDKAQWQRVLGNAGSELFDNVYAFSIDELMELESLRKSGMEDKIFSVGLGLGNISIGELESDLTEQAKIIYSAGGKTHRVAKLVLEIQAKKNLIQDIQSNLPKYEILNRQLTTLTSELEQMNISLAAHRRDRQQLEIYVKCNDSFVEAERYKKELSLLPPREGYPDGGLVQLEKLLENERTQDERLKILQDGNDQEKGLHEIEKERDSFITDEDFLLVEDNLNGLVNNLAKYNQSLTDLAEDKDKIKNLTSAINQELQQINTQWTVQDIREFGNTIVFKDKVAAFKQSQEEIANKKTRLEAEESAMAAGRPHFNIRAISNTISLILIILAGLAFFYKVYAVAGACLIIAFIIFFKKAKYNSSSDPLTDIRQKIQDLRETEEPNRRTEYNRFLTSVLRLQEGLSPDAVLEVFNSIDRAKRDMMDLDSLQKKINEERGPFIRKFEEGVSLLKRFADKPELIESSAEMVSHLREKMQSNKRNYEEKLRLTELYESKNNEMNNLSLKLTKTRDDIKNLLDGISAVNPDDFRKKYFQNDEITRLKTSLDSAELTIERIAGLNKYTAVCTFLREHDLTEINETITGLDQSISDIEQEMKVRNFSMGEKSKERNQITGESTLTKQLTELEILKEKMNLEYKNWVATRVAQRILEEIKSKYEREKQPVVIRNSARYFTEITDQKYKRIQVLADNKVVIYDNTESPKRIDQLSRGTREQLLISLRLGLIEQYESQAEPLPLIADEILVNFDPVRLMQTARVLHDFAKDRQVLLFTCNPATKDYFAGMNVHAIDL